MAGWVDGDNMTAKRRNREWWARFLSAGPIYDVANGGSVDCAAKSIDGDYVTTSGTAHWTVGASVTVGVLHSFTICNAESSSNHVRVNILALGGALAVSGTLFSGTVAANSTIVITGPWFLNASDVLYSISNAAVSGDVGFRAEATELTTLPSGITPKVHAGGALTTSPVAYYTCPASNVQHANVEKIVICNTDSSSRTVTAYVVPSGQGSAVRYAIFSGTIQAGETITLGDVRQPYLLEPGDNVQVLASVGSVVSCRVTATEYATS